MDGRMGRAKASKIALFSVLTLAALSIAAVLVLADTPFPGYFEVIPSCLSTLTCGQGENITVNGNGILNMLATPANGVADGLVTGVPVNVSWTTMLDNTTDYLMNASVYRANLTGHFLLNDNSTVSADHRVIVGPFEYSESLCPSVGCEIRLVVASCNSTDSVCINSSAVNSTFSIVVGPAIYQEATDALVRTGDLVNLSWRTRVSMNATVTWYSGSSANSTIANGHSAATGYFNATENVTFTIRDCVAAGYCEQKSFVVNVTYSAGSVTFNSTAGGSAVGASWSTHASSNSTIYFSANGGATSSSGDGLFQASHSGNLGSFSDGDSVTYYVRSCLAPNNCEITANSTLTIGSPPTTTTTAATTTVGGGGGGGGYYLTTTSIPIPAGASFKSGSVPAGAPVSFVLGGASSLAITTITFTHTSYAANATIVLTKLGAFSPEPPGVVYEYDNMTHYYIEDSKLVPPVKIDFRVAKSWIASSSIDASTIGLYRYSGGSWQAVPASSAGEDATYLYFTSQSPGMSVFAVTGQMRTAFWDLLSLIESYYSGDSSIDFWRVLDALTAYYSSGNGGGVA